MAHTTTTDVRLSSYFQPITLVGYLVSLFFSKTKHQHIEHARQSALRNWRQPC